MFAYGFAGLRHCQLYFYVFIFLMHSTCSHMVSLALAIVIFVSYNIMISTRHGNVVGMF